MITEFLNSVFGILSPELFFVFCFVAVFAAFTVCLFISVFKTDYGLKKRAWYFIIVALFCAVTSARANFSGGKDFTPILGLFGIALSLPLYFIRVKRVKAESEDASRREFVRFLDDKIKQGESINAFKRSADNTPMRERGEVLKVAPKKQEVTDGLDFSHVKNVLNRLGVANLSSSDRRQIHDLELLLYEAEHGECDAELKGKINEGLGNLLKIMAKHGV